MTKPSLKLLFLRKYRTSKKYYRQLRLPTAINGTSLSFSGVFPPTVSRDNGSIRNHPPISGIQGGGPSRRRPTGFPNKSASVDTVDCCVLICDCLSLYKLKIFVFIVVVGIVSTSGLYFHNQNLLQYRLNLTTTSNNSPNTVSDSVNPDSFDDSSNYYDEPFLQHPTSIDYTLHQPTSALRKKLKKINHHQHPSHLKQKYDEIVAYLNRVYREDVFSPKHGIRLKRCALPNLKPFSREVKQFIGYTPRPNCVREQRNSFEDEIPFFVRNGTVLVRNPKVDETQTRGCCYRPFHRDGDNNYWSSNYCKDITQEITHFPDEIEYLELLCINSDAQTDFRDAFALIPRKDQTEGRVETYEAEYPSSSSINADNRLSVVILGLDATSRMNFLRAMPKSNRYLLKNMSAISLDGYTKVAENTLPNVVPFLTGQTIEEFKKKCVDESKGGHSVHLDKCPFIWKVFAENGYRTSLAEDDVDIGIFNMNWANAFQSPPTDYYLRPFSHLMQRRHSFKNGYCYGSTLSFEKLLDNMRSMAEQFKGQSYFQFIWSTKLSHDDFNKLRWGDESLLHLLEYLHSGDYLNNTALFIVGDHGSRLDRIRGTAQGKLEDRMPVAYIALPEWFKSKYNQAYQNLRKNSNKITSAFDMHKTLYDLLNLDNLLINRLNSINNINEVTILPNQEKVFLGRYRGMSLFNELPENRTCFAAGVPLHWCVCHRKIPVDKESSAVQEAAEYVVASLNTLLRDEKRCAELILQSVDEASQWDPSEIIREGCQNKDDGHHRAGVVQTQSLQNNTNVIKKINSTSNNDNAANIHITNGGGNDSCSGSDSEVKVLQVAFTTTPGDATFETTVIQLQDGTWRLTEDVVRTNSYEGQSECVEQKLKPYCYCEEDDSFFGGFLQ